MADKTTFIATGDSFMTRRLPKEGYPGFEEIQNIIIYPEFIKAEIDHLDEPMKHFVSKG